MAGFYNCLKTNKNCIAMTTSEKQPEALDGEEAADASSGKKKSKFQTFKNFFAKKKKSRDPPSSPEETKRRPSQDSSDGGSPPLDSLLLHAPGEIEFSGSPGNQDLLQDDKFPFEALCDMVGDASLQENLSDDGLPRSLLDISTIHDVLTSSITQPSGPIQLCSSVSSDETDGEDNCVNTSQVTLGSLRGSFPLGSSILPLSHGIPVDFNTPASPLACLDTAAARHRIAMNPRKQKGFTRKSHHSLVEQMLEQQQPLEPAEDERNLSKVLAGQRKSWEGLLGHHVVNVNEDGTDHASPGTRTSKALPSSCSTDLHGDGTSVLISEAENLLETQLQLNSTKPSPNVPSSLTKDGEGENMDKEEKKGTCPPTVAQKSQSGPDVTEISESLHLKTKAIGLHSTSPSALPKSKVGKELGAQDNQIVCTQQTVARASVSKPARNRHRACARAVLVDGSSSLEAGPVLGVPQLSSSALKVSSDAPKDLKDKNRHAIDENGRGPSDVEFQPSQGHGKPMDSLQSTLSTSEVDSDRPVLLNAAGKKPADSTIQELGSLSSGRLATVGSTEVASKTHPPVSTPGVQLANVVTEEESKAMEMIKTQTKPSAVKPVRFTIAPAWQRSLSGDSSSVNNSYPRNSPTSPVKPELFEGTSLLDAGSPILNTPERPDGANRNTGVPLNSSSEEVQNCESPFGVKLRRTSSLLKYQTEHHWDPPKLMPLAVPSPSFVKTETKAANSGTNLQHLTMGIKGLVANSGIQEKNLQKTKAGEEDTKLQKTKAGEGGPKSQASKLSEVFRKALPATEVPKGLTKKRRLGLLLWPTSGQWSWQQIRTGRRVGEEPGPVLDSGEGSEEGSVSEAERGPEPYASYQLPSETDISGTEEQLEPVPSGRMRRAARRREELKNRGRLGSKATEQTPAVLSGSVSVQPTWVSVAKQKQQGFQDVVAAAKGQKKREEGTAKRGREDAKIQVTIPSNSLPKKTGPYQNVCLLESKVLLKSAQLAAKEGCARILPQESLLVEKDTRLPPILPGASCSSTEPPWLSLAKKKAKAWSEMPQAVQ